MIHLVAPMAHFMRPEDDWNEFFADPKRLRQGMQRLFEAEHGKRFALFQVRRPAEWDGSVDGWCISSIHLDIIYIYTYNLDVPSFYIPFQKTIPHDQNPGFLIQVP